MLAVVLTLHPQMSMGREGGCGTRLFGAENSIASVCHTFTSLTQRDIRSAADAESLRGKCQLKCVLDLRS